MFRFEFPISKDAHEWKNEAANPEYAQVMAQHRLEVPQERYEILGKGSTGHKSYAATENK